MTDSSHSSSCSSSGVLRLRKLLPEQVQQIDQLLEAVGEYGEVHLIVQHGKVKYVNKVESQRAWNHEEWKKT